MAFADGVQAPSTGETMPPHYLRCAQCQLTLTSLDAEVSRTFLADHHRHAGVWAVPLVDVDEPMVDLHENLTAPV